MLLSSLGLPGPHEEGGWVRVDIPVGLQPLFREPVPYAAVEEDDTSGLVTEVFDDSDKVGADFVLLHGCSQSCVPNPVEGLLEV